MAIDFYEVISRNPDVLRPVTMYEVQSDGVTLVEVIFDENGDFDTPEAPTLNTATSTLLTRTSAKIDWTPSPNGTPAVNFVVYRDGSPVSTSLPSTARTYTDSPLPTATPERIFSFTVAALGASGQSSGLSNPITLQWGSNPTQPPEAPTSLTASAPTDTSFNLTWAESTLAGIQKHTVKRGAGIVMKDDIAATATTTSVTGLTADTTYQGVFVTRTRTADGIESGPSPTVSPRTTGGTTGVQHDPVMGFITNDEWVAGKVNGYPLMDACRTNTISAMVGDQQLTGARVLAVSTNNSEGSITVNNGDLAASLRAGLEDFYYTAAGAARTGARSPTTGTQIRFATDNETDTNNGHPYSAGYGGVVAACADVIHNTLGGPGPGGRRYPLATMAANFTHGNISNAATAASYKPIARYLDVFTCSMYPPGRQAHTASGTVNDNVRWDAYGSYVDGVINVLHDWMLTGGAGGGPSNITGYATWEIGMPIDHPFRNGQQWSASNPSGEPTAQTNFTIRPRYFCGGRDSAGTNWVGFLQYVYNKLDAIGCRMLEQLYWNQQNNPDIPNPLWHDQRTRAWDSSTLPAPYNGQTASGATRANPDTETAWRAWVPGSRLADL